jgi:hypothetical protein
MVSLLSRICVVLGAVWLSFVHAALDDNRDARKFALVFSLICWSLYLAAELWPCFAWLISRCLVGNEQFKKYILV